MVFPVSVAAVALSRWMRGFSSVSSWLWTSVEIGEVFLGSTTWLDAVAVAEDAVDWWVFSACLMVNKLDLRWLLRVPVAEGLSEPSPFFSLRFLSPSIRIEGCFAFGKFSDLRFWRSEAWKCVVVLRGWGLDQIGWRSVGNWVFSVRFVAGPASSLVRDLRQDSYTSANDLVPVVVLQSSGPCIRRY